jgi:hypothetical protein
MHGSLPPLPPLPPLAVLEERTVTACAAAGAPLPVRAIAARTVFVMLYAGAVAGTSRWIRPAQVVRMSDAQAARCSAAERHAWLAASAGPGYEPPGRRWYAENTRESVRTVLRECLLRIGAVVERPGLPPSSAAPRWALDPAFVRLLTAPVQDGAAALLAWRAERHPASAAPALERLVLSFRRAAAEADAYLARPGGAADAAVRAAADALRSALDGLGRTEPPAPHPHERKAGAG